MSSLSKVDLVLSLTLYLSPKLARCRRPKSQTHNPNRQPRCTRCPAHGPFPCGRSMDNVALSAIGGRRGGDGTEPPCLAGGARLHMAPTPGTSPGSTYLLWAQLLVHPPKIPEQADTPIPTSRPRGTDLIGMQHRGRPRKPIIANACHVEHPLCGTLRQTPGSIHCKRLRKRSTHPNHCPGEAGHSGLSLGVQTCTSTGHVRLSGRIGNPPPLHLAGPQLPQLGMDMILTQLFMWGWGWGG